MPSPILPINSYHGINSEEGGLKKLKTFFKIFFISLVFVFSQKGFCQDKKNQSGSSQSPPSSNSKKNPSELEQSKSIKFNSKSGSKLDFEDTNIEGAVKNPFSSLLNTRDQEFKKGFVKLRTQWHDQMVLGISGLSQ